jgi:hypothetical protein
MEPFAVWSCSVQRTAWQGNNYEIDLRFATGDACTHRVVASLLAKGITATVFHNRHRVLDHCVPDTPISVPGKLLVPFTVDPSGTTHDQITILVQVPTLSFYKGKG